jgi:hypothetical protein
MTTCLAVTDDDDEDKDDGSEMRALEAADCTWLGLAIPMEARDCKTFG